MTTPTPTTPTSITKEIVYDRVTRDFALYLDGELVGYARTHHEGETTLDQLVYELLPHGPADEPAAAAVEQAQADAAREAMMARGIDLDALQPDEPLFCEGCGAEVAPDGAVLNGEQMVCRACAEQRGAGLFSLDTPAALRPLHARAAVRLEAGLPVDIGRLAEAEREALIDARHRLGLALERDPLGIGDAGSESIADWAA